MNVPTADTSWKSSGWVAFAGLFLVLSGFWNVIYGLALLIKDRWAAVTDEGLLILDLSAWGWILLITGALKLLTGLGLLRGQDWARPIAVILVMLNILQHMAFATANPGWTFLTIGFNSLILFALVVPREDATRAERYWDQAERPPPGTIPR